MDLWNTNQGPIKFVTGELINMTKRCYTCKVIFPKDMFALYSNGRLSSYCNSCENQKRRVYRQNNKDKIRISSTKYISQENPFIRVTLGRIFKPSSINPKPSKGYQRKGWEPEITKEELYGLLMLHIEHMKARFPGSDGRLCRYCLEQWTYIRKGEKDNRRMSEKNFSMDRFDTMQTYKKGNVVFCCGKCNSLKNGSEKWLWIRCLEVEEELRREHDANG
jgi:hypothetical protein